MSIYGKHICLHKRQFNTRDSAWNFSMDNFKDYGNYNSVYKCQFCKKYHLTQKYHYNPSKLFIKRFNKWFGINII